MARREQPGGKRRGAAASRKPKVAASPGKKKAKASKPRRPASPRQKAKAARPRRPAAKRVPASAPAPGQLRIGFCYDLRDDWRATGLSEEQLAEFDSPVTIAALRAAITDYGCHVDPIGGLRALLGRLQRGDRWDLVFNITEGRSGFGREAQVPALLDAFAIPYTFADPLVATVTLHKAVTKRLLRDAGIPTAPFALVETRGGAAEVDLPFPLLAKPVAEGTSKGIGPDAVVRDRAALIALCDRLLAEFRQPVLVEAFLPGRELTVGIVGSGAEARSIGALEVMLLPGADAEVCTFRTRNSANSCAATRWPSTALRARPRRSRCARGA
jgi:D-alanine-D-alanine ligase